MTEINLISEAKIGWPNKKKGHIYALSRSTVGFSAVRDKNWERQALAHSNISIVKNNFALKINIPSVFGVFYNITENRVFRDWTFLDEGVAIINFDEPIFPEPVTSLDEQIAMEQSMEPLL